MWGECVWGVWGECEGSVRGVWGKDIMERGKLGTAGGRVIIVGRGVGGTMLG